MEPFPFADSDRSERFDFLLYCRAVCSDGLSGRWQFALEDAAGETVVEADDEDGGDLNRLTLWALVRGLEAIDGESSVTLLSCNRYVIRSLTDHLPRWRENQFVWEHFGRYTEVQNADLWRRVDRALRIHRVEACLVQSRLISDGRRSTGSEAADSMDDGDAPILRVDAAHSPVTSQMSLHSPSPTNDPHQALVGSAPPIRRRGNRPMADPLRRFLMSSPESARARHGRRFTAADLAGN